jgi:hypothetical protein
MTNAGKTPSRKRVESQEQELERLFRQAVILSRKSKESSPRERAEEAEHSASNKRK